MALGSRLQFRRESEVALGNRRQLQRGREISYGFTLLEVIIAMALTSTLMLLVWSLFSTYTKLDERSSRAAVELQLVRSVSQQLRSDL